MEKEVLSYVTEKTNELLSAPSCCAELKAVAQNWLDCVGTDKEAEAAKKYAAELEASIVPIDGLIAFAESEHGVQVFGAEKAGQLAAHAKEIKADGAQYCDCPACSAAAAILEKKAALL